MPSFPSLSPRSPSPLLLIALAAFAVLAFAPFAASPAAANSCSATNTCGSQPSVSCSGSSSCLVGSNYVECDGQKTYCETTFCTAQYTCPSPPYSNPYYLFCSSSSGQCSVNASSDSVTCDSTTLSCADCEAASGDPRLILCPF